MIGFNIFKCGLCDFAAFYFIFLKWSEKIIYLGFGELSLVFFKKLVDVQSEIAENLGSRNSTMSYIT